MLILRSVFMIEYEQFSNEPWLVTWQSIPNKVN